MTRSPQSYAAFGEKLEPVRRETVMETVARRIEALVRSGQLRAGDKLPPEPELAKLLGVSRSSLREALKGMMFLGLIKAKPGQGTYLRPSVSRVLGRHFQWMVLLNEIQYFDVLEMRKVLEPAAAAFAAKRATSADIDRMERAILAMRDNVDNPDQFSAHDIEFHDAFASAANNPVISTVMRMLYNAIIEGRNRVLPLIDNMERHWDRHDRMFRSIRDGKPEMARKAVLADLLYHEHLLREDLDKAERSETNVLKSGRRSRSRATSSSK